jgi:cysteine desulfurase family protein (TIGR01976 family)
MSSTVAPYRVEAVRARFPALARRHGDATVAWLDGPAGTQVPDACLDAMRGYLTHSSSNTHGAFAASAETDALIAATRAATADLLGAADPDEVAFGQSMTALTYALSRAIGASLSPGDEIVLTRMDHDANVAPWLTVAQERGLVVRWVGIDPEDVTLRLEDLERALGPRTRLVAVGLASNAVGTINPVRAIADRVHAAGARLWVDAVHGAPHLPIDVGTLGADFLVCSAYKLYGPHLGILWGRRELLEALPPYHVRPAGDAIPGRVETGTLAHELLAGLGGTLRHLEWLGVAQGAGPGEPGADDGLRRERLRAAFEASRSYERTLVTRLIERVHAVRGARIRGITDPGRYDERCPTIALTFDGHHPAEVARFLGTLGIFVWDGDYYAWELSRALGLAESGGMVRIGLVNYNTGEEVDRVGDALEALVAS